VVELQKVMRDKDLVAPGCLPVLGDRRFDSGKEAVVQFAPDGGEESTRSAAHFQKMLVGLQIQMTDNPVNACARMPG
jgi:hypothetical protein